MGSGLSTELLLTPPGNRSSFFYEDDSSITERLQTSSLEAHQAVMNLTQATVYVRRCPEMYASGQRATLISFVFSDIVTLGMVRDSDNIIDMLQQLQVVTLGDGYYGLVPHALQAPFTFHGVHFEHVAARSHTVILFTWEVTKVFGAHGIWVVGEDILDTSGCDSDMDLQGSGLQIQFRCFFLGNPDSGQLVGLVCLGSFRRGYVHEPWAGCYNGNLFTHGEFSVQLDTELTMCMFS